MTSLPNPLAIKVKLAEEYFASGRYEQALNFMTRFQGRQRRRFRREEFMAHYHMGVLRCAENNFGQARKHFSEALQLAPTRADRRLCQGRLAALNHLLLNPSPELPESIRGRQHNCPQCSPEKTFYDCAVCEYIQAVHKTRKLGRNDLKPEIDAVYAVGAYRTWWDQGRDNPYSQAVKQVQRRESQILIEPLGILLADFITNGEAASLRQQVDFISPMPGPVTAVDSWRYQALALIGDVIGRRFGIPHFPGILRLQGPPRRTARTARRNRPQEPFAVVDPELVTGRQILLLDDITTYHQTVRLAAQALKQAGAAAIHAVILAYTEPSPCNEEKNETDKRNC